MQGTSVMDITKDFINITASLILDPEHFLYFVACIDLG